MPPRAAIWSIAAIVFVPSAAVAHEPSELAKQQMVQGGFADVAWLGAEHMLTGYDHLLFLLGLLFFVSRPAQIVSFITAFTFGHALVLLVATPLSIAADPHLIDALIALTVIYKALENLGWLQRAIGTNTPPLLPMIFLFGLIHGFGLSTRFQQMALTTDPDFFEKIIAFNIGVELGQIVALAAMGGALYLWRRSRGWAVLAYATNILLVICGAILFGLQVRVLFAQPPADDALVSGRLLPAWSVFAIDRGAHHASVV